MTKNKITGKTILYIFLPLLCFIYIVLCAPATCAKNIGYHYAGLEFFGSSQISRMDLQRILSLRNTSSAENVQRALAKLSGELTNRHLDANVEMVAVKPDKLFVVVDITDSSLTSKLHNRLLKDPGHRNLHSDKPFALLADLHARIAKLKEEGMADQEDFKDGIETYQDEACNQIVERLVKWVPTVEAELFAIINSDPDPARRGNAVELLNWADDTTPCTIYLTGVIDDADSSVRIQADKYIYPRLNLLPETFPADKLAYAWSHQLIRPSHEDRSKALYCLSALIQRFPEATPLVKSLCQDKVNELAQESIIETINKPAADLASALNRAQGLPFLAKPEPESNAPNRNFYQISQSPQVNPEREADMTSEVLPSATYARQLFADLASMIKQQHFHQQETVKQDNLSARGDELKEAGEYHELAKLLVHCRQNKAALVAQALARELVAKQLNDMDGFDR